MRIPRLRSTVRRHVVVIACLGIGLGLLRFLLVNDPFFGFGTIYSEKYNEKYFKAIRVGMTQEEVEKLMGAPLWKDPCDGKIERWSYSDQPGSTANYWRRWVFFINGKVVYVICDFWID